MKIVKITTGRVHKTMYQDEPKLWPADKAAKRQLILDQVGAEYSQINLLINVLNVVVAKIPELQDDKDILAAMTELNRINEIRTSVVEDPISVLTPPDTTATSV